MQFSPFHLERSIILFCLPIVGCRLPLEEFLIIKLDCDFPKYGPSINFAFVWRYGSYIEDLMALSFLFYLEML